MNNSNDAWEQRQIKKAQYSKSGKAGKVSRWMPGDDVDDVERRAGKVKRRKRIGFREEL